MMGRPCGHRKRAAARGSADLGSVLCSVSWQFLDLSGIELSEETHGLTKQEALLGRGARVESSRVREPRRTALPHDWQSQVLM